MGRDSRVLSVALAVSISIHAPRVGRDPMCVLLRLAKHYISIHAPRVGRDVDNFLQVLENDQFQSTCPVWGATGNKIVTAADLRISIHAPRVGRDDGRPALP